MWKFDRHAHRRAAGMPAASSAVARSPSLSASNTGIPCSSRPKALPSRAACLHPVSQLAVRADDDLQTRQGREAEGRSMSLVIASTQTLATFVDSILQPACCRPHHPHLVVDACSPRHGIVGCSGAGACDACKRGQKHHLLGILNLEFEFAAAAGRVGDWRLEIGV